MEIIKDYQEVCLDKLSVLTGKELEISANLTDPRQMELIRMRNVYGQHGLRSRYFTQQTESMLRLTISYMGRGRDDIRAIGTTAKIQAPTWGTYNGGQQ